LGEDGGGCGDGCVEEAGCGAVSIVYISMEASS
jgi:hypothetical protein